KARPAALPAPGGQSPEKLSSKRKPNRLMMEADTAIGPRCARRGRAYRARDRTTCHLAGMRDVGRTGYGYDEVRQFTRHADNANFPHSGPGPRAGPAIVSPSKSL